MNRSSATVRIGAVGLIALCAELAFFMTRGGLPRSDKGWDVYDDVGLAAWVDDKPGRIDEHFQMNGVRRANPVDPPPKIHSFATLISRDDRTGDQLRSLLNESANFRDFAAKLEKYGYSFKAAKRTPGISFD